MEQGSPENKLSRAATGKSEYSRRVHGRHHPQPIPEGAWARRSHRNTSRWMYLFTFSRTFCRFALWVMLHGQKAGLIWVKRAHQRREGVNTAAWWVRNGRDVGVFLTNHLLCLMGIFIIPKTLVHVSTKEKVREFQLHFKIKLLLTGLFYQPWNIDIKSRYQWYGLMTDQTS